MKKYICLLLSLFLFIPFMVKAETLTYNVCESGCEYTSLSDVNTAINNLTDLSDKDIVININTEDLNWVRIGSNNNIANSITINGNDQKLVIMIIYSKKAIINRIGSIQALELNYTQKNIIKNSFIDNLRLYSINNQQLNNQVKNFKDIMEIDNISLKHLKTIAFGGYIEIENMDFQDKTIFVLGSINIYNSQINKIINYPRDGPITTNIYNSSFNSLKYINIMDDNGEIYDEYFQAMTSVNVDLSKLNYDIYDAFAPEYSNTTVYFDKEAKIKPGDKLNLVSYLDYYTEDKEIEYTIDDESIAKIENKELIALKEGSTKVTVTTDDGHIVYRINLTVEKETIPEKIDKMTIKVPITGSKVKAWILIVGGILLGIVLICVYMLVKRKK